MADKLFLLFNLNDERFAVGTESISEIIPLVTLTKVPKTAPYIAGLLNYRGETMPVIDTVMLLYDKPHQRKICTRIIILSSTDEDCLSHVGLIVESANRTVKYDSEQISEHRLTQQHTAYLGKTLNDEQGEIQLLDIEKLIPQEAGCLKSAAGYP